MRFLTLSVFATLLSAPSFAADLGTYRPGMPYNSSVASGADVCDSQCSGDAQCRGWNYVKPNPRVPGVCEFLSNVSSPIPSPISISGENITAVPFSSRVTSGDTNTIRVGTQVPSGNNNVRVGQAPMTRRIVRQPVPQRAISQRASTPRVENMSLTEQQNRYRYGQGGQSQPPLRQAVPQQANRPAMPMQAPMSMRAPMPMQAPMFHPMLDGPSAAAAQQVNRQQQHQQQQTGRRFTGPRNAPAPASAPYAPQAAYQAPYAPNPYGQNPAWRHPAAQNPVMARGSSRPPVGQPIAPPQQARAPQPSTPSQRLAQFKAQNQAPAQPILSQGPVALNPQQARKSLFGSLNDDLISSTASDLPTATAVPTAPVTQQELGAVLAGGF